MRTPIGDLPLAQITPAALDARLRHMERAGAAATFVNRLREVQHTVFSRAIKVQLWTGANPVAAVETRRVPRRAYATLRAEEVPILLPHVPDDWRGVFAAALYTGMRKGKPFGFPKADVDLDRRTIAGVDRCEPGEPARHGRAAGVARGCGQPQGR